MRWRVFPCGLGKVKILIPKSAVAREILRLADLTAVGNLDI